PVWSKLKLSSPTLWSRSLRTKAHTSCSRLSFSFGTCDDPTPLSFPTRRSSDLRPQRRDVGTRRGRSARAVSDGREAPAGTKDREDRKSTRLNSSHLGTSYAVFCLKKKNRTPSCLSRPPTNC